MRAMPQAMVQFEDFGNANAFRLLAQWRSRICCFNDDIQGTAAMTLAGLLSAFRIIHKPIEQQRFLFFGAGEAAIGMGDLIVAALVEIGVSLEEARRHCWCVDTQGLIVKSRENLAEHKLRFAHDFPHAPDLLSAIRALQPDALIGVSTVAELAFREGVARVDPPESLPELVQSAMWEPQYR